MDHLASCYFCGTALDEPLEDYRVVPAELRDDDAATTATLCPSCRGKLERLFAPVVEAAGGDDATLEAADRTGAVAARGNASGGDTPSPGEETGGTRTAEPAEAGQTAESGTEANEANPDRQADGDRSQGSTESGDLRDAMEPDVPDALQSGGDNSGVEPEVEPVGEAANEDAEGDDEDHRDADDGTTNREEGEPGDANDGGGSDARTTISALEYNKVMRLLQNREFPVERGEIQTVAANAYGLAESECAAVIDLAIDRGLVDEDGGQLVRSG